MDKINKQMKRKRIQRRSKRETYRCRGIHFHIQKHNKDANFGSNNIQSKLVVCKIKYSNKEL